MAVSSLEVAKAGVFCLPGDEPMHFEDEGQYDAPMDEEGMPDQEDVLQHAASPSRSARR